MGCTEQGTPGGSVSGGLVHPCSQASDGFAGGEGESKEINTRDFQRGSGRRSVKPYVLFLLVAFVFLGLQECSSQPGGEAEVRTQPRSKSCAR